MTNGPLVQRPYIRATQPREYGHTKCPENKGRAGVHTASQSLIELPPGRGSLPHKKKVLLCATSAVRLLGFITCVHKCKIWNARTVHTTVFHEGLVVVYHRGRRAWLVRCIMSVAAANNLYFVAIKCEGV